jgi:ribonuclease HI
LSKAYFAKQAMQMTCSLEGPKSSIQLPTNNEAEYKALLHGMRMTKACGATRLDIYGDSNLVVQHSMNLCDAISDNMIAYRQMYQSMETKFEGCELKHIDRASNKEGSCRWRLPQRIGPCKWRMMVLR